MAYNSAVHSTTKSTPYELMFGRKPKLPIDLIYEVPIIRIKFDPEGYAIKIKETLKRAHDNVRKNRDSRMLKAKIIFNRNVMATPFKKGDSVWLKNKEIRKGQCKKFIFKWKGPYKSIEKIKDTNYIIKPLNKKGRQMTVNRVRLKRHFYNAGTEPELNDTNKPQRTSGIINKAKPNRAKELLKRANKAKPNKNKNYKKATNDDIEKVGEVNIVEPSTSNSATENMDQQNKNLYTVIEKNNTSPNIYTQENSTRKDPNYNIKITNEIYARDRPQRTRRPPDRFEHGKLVDNSNQIIIRCFPNDTTSNEQNFYIDQLRQIGPIRYFRIMEDMNTNRHYTVYWMKGEDSIPTEQVNETLPIRLLSLANDTQQQRTEQNVVTTENQINVNVSTIRTTPLESRTIRGNIRPNGAIRLIALESVWSIISRYLLVDG
ncbi:unnamed protein product [Brachionus calyciflorus]|uniref:Uncharacterized protein n=1 Tax=Brachionus calyciflorus TaxID=104777 RepID=A0A814C6F8_9BILA|nr:unnamed protein product [Brachionus calyciflorus]